MAETIAAFISNEGNMTETPFKKYPLPGAGNSLCAGFTRAHSQRLGNFAPKHTYG